VDGGQRVSPILLVVNARRCVGHGKVIDLIPHCSSCDFEFDLANLTPPDWASPLYIIPATPERASATAGRVSPLFKVTRGYSA
jgi:hypothetical protein